VLVDALAAASIRAQRPSNVLACARSRRCRTAGYVAGISTQRRRNESVTQEEQYLERFIYDDDD
jgi:hypothetical protein